MADWRSFFDKKYLCANDLCGQDVTLTIRDVQGVTVQGRGVPARKPLLTFVECPKGVALNATNAAMIASFYGNDCQAWIGRLVTFYPTKTPMGVEVVDCIRVRPVPPSAPTPPDQVAALLARAAVPAGPVHQFSPNFPPPAQFPPAPPPQYAQPYPPAGYPYPPPPYAPPQAFQGWPQPAPPVAAPAAPPAPPNGTAPNGGTNGSH